MYIIQLHFKGVSIKIRTQKRTDGNPIIHPNIYILTYVFMLIQFKLILLNNIFMNSSLF